MTTSFENDEAGQSALSHFVTYKGHLESSGNSEISQSQKQQPVCFSYQCKGLYLFYQLMIFSTMFIVSVKSYCPLQ